MQFQYNKKIDQWSYRMIKNLKEVWGTRLNKNDCQLNYKTLPLLKNYLNNYWQKYGAKVIKKLDIIFKLDYQPNDFKLYLNTTNVSLHNADKKFISISLNHSFASYPTIIIHELCHIYFYQYIKNRPIAGLSEGELNELKEIITVIINDECLDCIDCLDAGYPDHKKIREQVKKIWQQNKNMDALMAKMIKIYKKIKRT